MNGFLERLVARAEQRAPMVERRQPGLFEPRPWGGAAIAAAAGPWLEQDDGEQAAVRAEGSPRGRSVNDPPRTRPGDVAQSTAALSRIAALQQAPATNLANPDSGPLHGAPSKDIASRAEPVKNPRRAARPPAAIESELLPPVSAETSRRHTSSTAPPRARAQAAAAESPRPRSSATTAETPQQAPRAIVAATAPRPLSAPPRPALPPLPRLVAPATAPPPARAQALRMAAAAKAPAAAAPRLPAPVQVTIGRVEVRSMSPAPTNKGAAKTAGARLSLDDYLRQRHGAGR